MYSFVSRQPPAAGLPRCVLGPTCESPVSAASRPKCAADLQHQTLQSASSWGMQLQVSQQPRQVSISGALQAKHILFDVHAAKHLHDVQEAC